jgi:hypothetical protein
MTITSGRPRARSGASVCPVGKVEVRAVGRIEAVPVIYGRASNLTVQLLGTQEEVLARAPLMRLTAQAACCSCGCGDADAGSTFPGPAAAPRPRRGSAYRGGGSGGLDTPCARRAAAGNRDGCGDGRGRDAAAALGGHCRRAARSVGVMDFRRWTHLAGSSHRAFRE